MKIIETEVNFPFDLDIEGVDSDLLENYNISTLFFSGIHKNYNFVNELENEIVKNSTNKNVRYKLTIEVIE